MRVCECPVRDDFGFDPRDSVRPVRLCATEARVIGVCLLVMVPHATGQISVSSKTLADIKNNNTNKSPLAFPRLIFVKLSNGDYVGHKIQGFDLSSHLRMLALPENAVFLGKGAKLIEFYVSATVSVDGIRSLDLCRMDIRESSVPACVPC